MIADVCSSAGLRCLGRRCAAPRRTDRCARRRTARWWSRHGNACRVRPANSSFAHSRLRAFVPSWPAFFVVSSFVVSWRAAGRP